MNSHNILISVAVSFLIHATTVSAQDEEPLHLVISEVGNRIVTYGTEDDSGFTMMAEIVNALNFSLRGDFSKAEIVSASTVAPDGKTYQLKAIGDQPTARPGTLLQFLFIVYGDAHTGFSIGKWDATIKFKVDGQEYEHKATYLVTWRKPEEGIWQGQHWANESPAEQGGAGQPATAPDSKPEDGENPKSESEPASR